MKFEPLRIFLAFYLFGIGELLLVESGLLDKSLGVKVFSGVLGNKFLFL